MGANFTTNPYPVFLGKSSHLHGAGDMVQAVQATISPWLPQAPKDRGTEGAAASVVTAAAKDHRFQGLRRGEEFPLEAWHFAPGAVGSGG